MILIAEDNSMSARILQMTLEKEGYTTIIARDGKEALSILRLTPGISLILADIMMPEMDGLDLLASIKKENSLRDIPVIMTTSLTDIETVKKAAFLGCRHYLAKPIDREMLLFKVKEAVAKEQIPVRDKFFVMAKMDLDLKTYKEIAAMFVARLDATADMLKRPAGDASSGLSEWELLELRENAEMFGADGLVGLIDQLTGGLVEELNDKAGTVLRERLVVELNLVRTMV